LEAYDRWLLRAAARRILKEAAATRGAALEGMREWLDGHLDDLHLGFRPPQTPTTPPRGFLDRFFDAPAPGAVYRSAEEALAATEDEPEPAPADWVRRIGWIGDRFELAGPERDVLGFVMFVYRVAPAWRLISKALESFWPTLRISNAEALAYALALGINDQPVMRAFGAKSQLVRTGLIEISGDDRARPGTLLMRIVDAEDEALDRLRAELVGERVEADLEWEAFGHLGGRAELAERVVKAALDHRLPGSNLLLYGPPGTGKTAFAAALAHRVGATLIAVGETDDWGGEPDRFDRVRAVATARALLNGARGVVLLVDEADDLFVSVDDPSGASRKGSKAFLHRLLENIPVPTLWITNRPGWIGPAILRRMAMAIPFHTPPIGVRRAIVERSAARHGVALAQGDVERVAAAAEVAPGVIATAARATATMGGSVDDLVQLTESVTALLGPRPQAYARVGFDLALARADVDLVSLAERVAASPTMALSFCLAGPPGTGKSAFARHLADRIGLEVMDKRASDLLDPYVGVTERRIAEAFEEAAERRAFLIIDEADSLIADRRGATRTWEVSQVNELLVALERHPYPVAVTTNRFEAFDPASLRRFLFRVQFLALAREQLALAFERFFRVPPPPGLERLDDLTPGDFAVVSRRATVMAERDPQALLAWLAAESEAKRPGQRPIGFRAEVG
jgi:transitional endoplasmic reticulum ATPase